MRTFFIILFSVCNIVAESQVSLEWVKKIGTSTNTSPLDHKVDSAGNLFVFGKTEDIICGYDAFFISELDINGNEIHQTIIDTDISCNREVPAAFSLGSGNHILTCGYQPNNQAGALLFGLDTNNLSPSWSRDTGFYYVDCVHGFSNEDYVVGNNPPELQRWSESGNFSWSYSWSGPPANAFKTFKDKNNGVYMLVTTFDTVPNTFQSGFGLVKRDENNVNGWSIVHNPKPAELNVPIGAVQDISGNTYVLSKTITTTDSIFLNKISPSGQLLWTSSYGPAPYAYDLKYDLTNNNILTVLRVNSGLKIIRFDSNGALIDTTTTVTQFVYGNPVFDVDTLGNSYIAYEFQVSASSFVLYVNKYNYGGGVLWSYLYPTTKQLIPRHLSVQSDGSVFVTLTKHYTPPLVDSIIVIKLNQPLSVLDQNESTLNFSVFPNPTSGNCFYQLSGNSSSRLHYKISDLSGKLLLEGKCSDTENGEIDLTTLSPSVYFISIFDEKGSMISAPQKIVKL